jgi:F-type H+-transporting ATPase subunit a
MSTNQRGLMIFGFIVAFAVFFCGLLPFMILPGAGIAMALPVIQVPGEVLVFDWPSPDFELTNTLIGMFLADLLVILIAVMVSRQSKGWTKKVPGRFQALVEAFGEFVYGLVKQMAGTSNKVRNQLFPLVATIFLFLLVANWLELVPGVDSIGFMHCAKPGMNGYARSGATLYNDQALFPGYTLESEESYHICEEYLEGKLTEPFAAASAEELEAELADAESHLDGLEGDALDAAHAHIHEIELRLHGAEHAHDVEALLADEALTEEERSLLETELMLAQTQVRYPGAIVPLTEDELEAGIQPYAFIVTPWVRAAATDLNLTLGLALISFAAIQYFGISTLGGFTYGQKFINIGALGNLQKRPLGAIDFLVGLFEIISELSKVISLAFRLFGNIFAGQLLLFIMAFLVATMLPVIFYGLEFIVGFIQALVFAVLTLVFSAQAMEDHSHHDDDEHH